jgi:hypothetical protein
MSQTSAQQSGRVKAIRWLLLFVVGTIVGCLLLFVIPYGGEAPEFLVYTTKFWIHDRFPNSISIWSTPLKITSGLFAGTDTYVEDVVIFVLTALYFGVVVALVGSGNKRQVLIAAGLVTIYLIGTFYVLYLRILGLS